MTVPSTSVPAVIYAARSQAEEPGKDSTGDQLALIREALEHAGARTIDSEHIDHASGYRGDRGPGLEAAMCRAVELAREHETVELWVWISSRLARGSGLKGEARSVLEVFAYLRRNGVTLRSVEDDQFVTSPMLVGFAAEQAEKYSRDLAANVKRGIASKVSKGKPWGEPGFGYEHDSDGCWQVEPVEAAAARRAFAEYVERTPSYSGVARVLNDARVRPRRSTRWTPTVIKRLLTSRHVLGEFHHGGEWHQGSHEAIVDFEIWAAAQALASQGAKYAPRGRAGRLPKAHVFVRGLLRCGMCGQAMLPRSDEGRETYVCRSRKTWGACTMPVLRRETVETAALSLFEERALDYEATREHIADQLGSRRRDALAQAERADREISELGSQTARVERDYRRSALPAEDYRRLRASIEEETTAANAEAERLREHVRQVGDQLAHLDAESETLRRLAELRTAVASRIAGASRDVGALRAAIAAVFESIVVYRDPSGQPRLLVTPKVRGELPNGQISLQTHRAPIAFDATSSADKSTSSGVPE